MGPPTTRLHVSGYRFLVRRMEHALVRGDARMLDDPLRAQSLSLAAGAVLAAVAVAVCAVLAVVRPAGDVGDAAVVVVRETGALYVRVDDTLHPVLNLASARLIAGTSAAPRAVSQAAVDRAKRGPLMGIPGAPEQISQPLSGPESLWTVCDDGRGETTVIAGRIADDAAAPGRTVVVTPRGGSAAATYLLYDGRRARVDLRHPAVVRALQLDGVVAQPVSSAVLSAIPEAPAIEPPHIPGLGTAGPGPLRDHSVGSVVAVARAGAVEFFAVLAGGVQRIGEVTADLIRYTDSRVGQQIPTVAPDVIGALPVVDDLPVTTYPDRGGVTAAPVVCVRWQPAVADSGAHTTVLAGEAIPGRDRPVPLAQADGDGPAVDAVAVPAGRSVFVRSVGLTALTESGGSLFLLTDSGVLFAVEDSDAASRLGLPPTAAAAPWPVLAVLPRGPDLSRGGASIARDGIAATP